MRYVFQYVLLFELQYIVLKLRCALFTSDTKSVSITVHYCTRMVKQFYASFTVQYNNYVPLPHCILYIKINCLLKCPDIIS